MAGGLAYAPHADLLIAVMLQLACENRRALSADLLEELRAWSRDVDGARRELIALGCAPADSIPLALAFVDSRRRQERAIAEAPPVRRQVVSLEA